MLKRWLTAILDMAFGWKSRTSSSVCVGNSSVIAWRRLKGIAGNTLVVGDHSIVHADLRFEDRGGEIRIGSRTYIGRSNLICFRNIVIGDDVIMSWGITVVDHDSHSIHWEQRKNDVLEWGRGLKIWDSVGHAPVHIAGKAWIGFNVSILKGVKIGEGAVVGACSVVTRDVPPYSVVAGNPARVVRSLIDSAS